MNKKHYLLPCFISIFFFGYGQSSLDRIMTPVQIPTNIERYNIDYKLLDESVIAADSTILNQIDLDALDVLRAPNENITVHDESTNLDVILFYKKNVKKTNVLLNPTMQ